MLTTASCGELSLLTVTQQQCRLPLLQLEEEFTQV
jgi:hypothetical protein